MLGQLAQQVNIEVVLSAKSEEVTVTVAGYVAQKSSTCILAMIAKI